MSRTTTASAVIAAALVGVFSPLMVVPRHAYAAEPAEHGTPGDITTAATLHPHVTQERAVKNDPVTRLEGAKVEVGKVRPVREVPLKDGRATGNVGPDARQARRTVTRDACPV